MKNFARRPQGADATLLQSVAAGECGVTIANHYYFVRLETSKSRPNAMRPQSSPRSSPIRTTVEPR